MNEKQTKKQTEVRFLVSDLKIDKRSEDPEGRTISGYAAKFNTWSEPILEWFIERLDPGAFAGCDMSDAIMCFNHDENKILARTNSGTLTLTIDEIGLYFSFDAPATTTGNDVVELVRRGDVTKCSFKFMVEQDSWIYADDDNGHKYDQRTISKIAKLYDVSLVVYPAYSDTEASVRNLKKRVEANRQKKQDVKEQKIKCRDSKKAGNKLSNVNKGSLSRQRLVEQLRLKN